MQDIRLVSRRVLLAAPFGLALAGSPALAGPTQIRIFVGPRPAAPTAVALWSPGLTAEATTALAGKGGLPPTQSVANWIGINFSKHHIIQQSLLQVVAGLVGNADAGPAETRARLKKALNTIAAGVAFAPDGTPNLGPIAWSRVNLFEGPTGYYRGDDPGDGPEIRKPKSFSDARWRALQSVSDILNGLGRFEDRTAGDGKDFVIATKALTAQQKGGKTGLETIVAAFDDLGEVAAAPAAVQVQAFDGMDWVGPSKAPLALADLIVFRDSTIQVALNAGREHAYTLR